MITTESIDLLSNKVRIAADQTVNKDLSAKYRRLKDSLTKTAEKMAVAAKIQKNLSECFGEDVNKVIGEKLKFFQKITETLLEDVKDNKDFSRHTENPEVFLPTKSDDLIDELNELTNVTWEQYRRRFKNNEWDKIEANSLFLATILPSDEDILDFKKHHKNYKETWQLNSSISLLKQKRSLDECVIKLNSLSKKFEEDSNKISPDFKNFFEKANLDGARYDRLTPDVLKWLEDDKIASKFVVRIKDQF
jgi:hypothetical protein